jgi:hypothetical protein
MPGVCLPFVPIWTLMWRAWKRAGWRRWAITQGSCRGRFRIASEAGRGSTFSVIQPSL